MQRYWAPLIEVREKLLEKIGASSATAPLKCLEIGPGKTAFPLATHFVDLEVHHPNTLLLDIDEETLPWADHSFDFAYSRHTLEDIQNPNHVFKEMVRVSPRGFIETPSPMVELTAHVDNDPEKGFDYYGYIHHRYVLWSEAKTNTLFCLPKYPLIDHATVADFPELRTTPVYWNNYYFWDVSDPAHLPKMVMLKHGKNFQINTDYDRLLSNAVVQSREYTATQLLQAFPGLHGGSGSSHS